MSDLLPYNPAFVGYAKGLPNLGNSCYLNSLLQCLLSCSSVFEVATKQPNVNQLSILLNELHLAARDPSSNLSDLCVRFWRTIISASMSRRDRIQFSFGSQQDSHEGLMLLLDMFESLPNVRRLFEHRHRLKIVCGECSTVCVDKQELGTVFEVQPDLKSAQLEVFKDLDRYYGSRMSLNDFLRSQNGYVEGYNCTKCSSKKPKFKTVSLTMVPEILPIVIKKYEHKELTPFPEYLDFVTVSGRSKFVYRLIAQSEHSGTQAGGHYYAHCLRADRWHCLNDSSVSQVEPGATPNTYLIFYHYVSEIMI